MALINTLDEQSQSVLKLADLYRIKDILERMQKNIDLQAAGDNGNMVIVAGGNLFALAAKYYSDATLWTAIAEANKSLLLDGNGFINPFFTGVLNLVIPPKPAESSGGLFND